MTRQHAYKITPERLVGLFLTEKQLLDDKCKDYVAFMIHSLKQKGVDKFLNKKGLSRETLCKYFTTNSNTVAPITELIVEGVA